MSSIPTIKINMNNPYSAKTHGESISMWKKVYPIFKDIKHYPPFELTYAYYLNLINCIKKSSLCTNCHKSIEGTGLYFPLQNNYIMPLPCCEKCCTFEVTKDNIINKEVYNFIYVNKYQRSIKYYSWKMMICANLVIPMYNKMIKEEELNKLSQEKVIEEIVIKNREEKEIQNQEEFVIQNQLEKEIQIQNQEINEINNYYFGNIEEYDHNYYKNILSQNIYDEEYKNNNQNVLIIFISFIATILGSTLYYVFNK